MVAHTRKALVKKEEESYLGLVREFPLKVIRDERDHTRALDVLAKLASRPLDAGEIEYADVLGQLLSNFEDSTPGHRLDLSRLTPRQVLNHLIEESGITPSELNRLVGQSTASAYRNGRRPVSKANAAKLARRFSVSPALLLYPTIPRGR